MDNLIGTITTPEYAIFDSIWAGNKPPKIEDGIVIRSSVSLRGLAICSSPRGVRFIGKCLYMFNTFHGKQTHPPRCDTLIELQLPNIVDDSAGSFLFSGVCPLHYNEGHQNTAGLAAKDRDANESVPPGLPPLPNGRFMQIVRHGAFSLGRVLIVYTEKKSFKNRLRNF